MNEAELFEAISNFTVAEKKMPTKLRGSFKDLCAVSYFCAYLAHPGGLSGYKTPFGVIELVLDVDAEGWHLE